MKNHWGLNDELKFLQDSKLLAVYHENNQQRTNTDSNKWHLFLENKNNEKWHLSIWYKDKFSLKHFLKENVHLISKMHYLENCQTHLLNKKYIERVSQLDYCSGCSINFVLNKTIYHIERPVLKIEFLKDKELIDYMHLPYSRVGPRLCSGAEYIGFYEVLRQFDGWDKCKYEDYNWLAFEEEGTYVYWFLKINRHLISALIQIYSFITNFFYKDINIRLRAWRDLSYIELLIETDKEKFDCTNFTYERFYQELKTILVNEELRKVIRFDFDIY